jgi:heat-inducible transcriptional repressor
MNNDVISERAQRLLKSLIERYIREGQPVGSRSLLEEAGLLISPATVRNVMSDLEERGYVTAPHTSAGRVPTALGYRLFVDSLITMAPFDTGARQHLQLQLDPDKSAGELVQSASQMLSTVTSLAGLVTVPKSDVAELRQIEFLPLSGNRVLVILVVNEREVQNRVLHTSREYSEIELRQASNMINQRYTGQPLTSIRQGVLEAMQADKQSIDSYMQTTLDLASKAFGSDSEDNGNDYVMVGESQLISSTSPEDVEKLQGLFEAFENKKDILELIDRSIQADGVQIFIGEEAGYEALGDFSMVTAPYIFAGNSLGVLGIIGPTRMAYDKVIPVVDLTAKLLTLALK